jgi:hypothetical protein
MRPDHRSQRTDRAAASPLASTRPRRRSGKRGTARSAFAFFPYIKQRRLARKYSQGRFARQRVVIETVKSWVSAKPHRFSLILLAYTGGLAAVVIATLILFSH